MTEKTRNYVGYVRVSTKSQVEGHGLDVQKHSIKDYCKKNDINLVKIYADEGISAVSERPAFKKALDKVMNDDSIDGLITYDLTRFGRSILEIYMNITMLREKGKELIIPKNNFIIKKDMDSMMETMLGLLALFAQFERSVIRERMEAGKERAKIEGTKSGKPMHRPKKPIDWSTVEYYRKKDISWTKIASIVNVTPATLIKRAKEEGYYGKYS